MLKEGKAAYGVYCVEDKFNYSDRVEGEQTLQNATYQGILHVLKGMPLTTAINFVIDRKAVIDVMENFPKTYRNKQDSLHLDTLLQIEEILQRRTGKIIFSHCYSHTTDKNNNKTEKQIKENDEKIEKMC
jgi:ribonuclease HI